MSSRRRLQLIMGDFSEFELILLDFICHFTVGSLIISRVGIRSMPHEGER